MKNVSQLTNFVENKLNEYTETTTRTADVGIVLQVGDGIALIYGLENVASGELLEFGDISNMIKLNDKLNNPLDEIVIGGPVDPGYTPPEVPMPGLKY